MPSPFHGERLKALRTEAGWSQSEPEKIDSDARQVSRYKNSQVSRYKNSKVAPGLEAVIRMAQTFNVTVDYLLIDDADDARLADLDQLTDEERATITNVIDALVTKAKLRLITGGAG